MGLNNFTKLKFGLLVLLLIFTLGGCFSSSSEDRAEDYNLSGTIFDGNENSLGNYDDIVINIAGNKTNTVANVEDGMWNATARGTVDVIPSSPKYNFTPSKYEDVSREDHDLNFEVFMSEKKIISVEELKTISVSSGTGFNDLPLYRSVTVNLEGGSQIDTDVNWREKDFDSNKTGPQKITGDLINLPDYVVNSDKNKAEVIVNIESGTQPSEFIISKLNVEPEEEPDELIPGKETNLEFEVENTGEATGQQQVDFFIFDENDKKYNIGSKLIHLNGGKTKFISENIQIPEKIKPGVCSFKVESDNDYEKRKKYISKPAFFDVSLQEQEGDTEVKTGEQFAADVTITNKGEVAGTQEIIFDFGDNVEVDSTEISLEAGRKRVITMVYDVPGEMEPVEDLKVEVRSNDDNDIMNIDVLGVPEFDIKIVDYLEKVEIEDIIGYSDVSVGFVVKNTGNAVGEQALALRIDDTHKGFDNSKVVELAPGETEKFELEYPVEHKDAGPAGKILIDVYDYFNLEIVDTVEIDVKYTGDTGAIEGTVYVDEYNLPIQSDAVVRCVKSGKETTVDSNGDFHLEGLMPGDRRLQVEGLYNDTFQDIEVVPDMTSSDIGLRLPFEKVDENYFAKLVEGIDKHGNNNNGTIRWPIGSEIKIYFEEDDTPEGFNNGHKETAWEVVQSWDSYLEEAFSVVEITSKDEADFIVKWVSSAKLETDKAARFEISFYEDTNLIKSTELELDVEYTDKYLKKIMNWGFGFSLGLLGDSPYKEDVMYEKENEKIFEPSAREIEAARILYSLPPGISLEDNR